MAFGSVPLLRIRRHLLPAAPRKVVQQPAPRITWSVRLEQVPAFTTKAASPAPHRLRPSLRTLTISRRILSPRSLSNLHGASLRSSALGVSSVIGCIRIPTAPGPTTTARWVAELEVVAASISFKSAMNSAYIKYAERQY